MAQDFDPRDAKGSFSKLMNFDHMIGPSLIKFIYYAGLVVIAIYAVILLLGGLSAMRYAPAAAMAGIIGGAALLLVGTVFWRFSCELWVLAFKIHDRLTEIRDGRSGPPSLAKTTPPPL